jgi:hypothetical protein
MRGYGPECGGSSGHRSGAPGRGSYTRGGEHGAGYNNNNRTAKYDIPCQVCFKKNHTTAKCWHIFDENFISDQCLAAAAATSYGIDINWYADTNATNHVTGELDKLTVKNRYTGEDQIHTVSEKGMQISHTTIYTPRKIFILIMFSMCLR